MKKRMFMFCSTVFYLAFSVCSAFSFDGPLQIRNQFPLFFYINQPHLEKAAPEDSLSIGLSHSSLFMVKRSADWSVDMDMEITGLELRYRTDISALFELGIDVPLLAYNSGFMDNPLSSYHKLFGFPDYGRSSRPPDVFAYEVRKNGSLIIKGKSGSIGLGDSRFSVKRALFGGDPAVSLRADMEIPTGDAAKGFGSGGFDFGAALLIDKIISEKINSYINLGAVSPGDLKAHETVRLRNFAYAGAGIEAVLSGNIAVLGQILLQGSPFPKTGIPTIDRCSVLLSLGGRYYSGQDIFELSFSEDPNTAGAPDFTVAFSLKKKF